MKDYRDMTNEELGEAFREMQEWDQEACEELVARADMKEAWDAADGDTFESVLYEAAEKLEIEII